MPTLDGISPAIAFLAGLVSFVSPCVLPLVPAYLAYLGARAGRPAIAAGPGASPVATTASQSWPVVGAGLGFVAGLSLVFILFFYAFSIAVQPIRGYVPVVAGVFVIVMAFHVAGVIRILSSLAISPDEQGAIRRRRDRGIRAGDGVREWIR